MTYKIILKIESKFEQSIFQAAQEIEDSLRDLKDYNIKIISKEEIKE